MASIKMTQKSDCTLPKRQITFMQPNQTTNHQEFLSTDIVVITILCIIYNATVQPIVILFMISTNMQIFATIILLTMHICRCFSIISPFKIASLPFILTIAIFQMGSLLYLHTVFIFISFILAGLLYGSFKTIFQAHIAFIAKRNLFSQINFTYNSNRMFTFFAISRAVELTGNLFGFVLIAVTFSSQNASKHESDIACGRDFCFEVNPPSLTTSISPITNLFAIYNRNFIHISAQFTLYSLLCIAVFIAAIPLRSTHFIFNNMASDQSPIDILSKSSLNDIFPLSLASGYFEVFIFYEISNAITYCVTRNILTVCTIFIFVILFIIIFILFVTVILTNEVSLDAVPLFCAILTAHGSMTLLWFWRPKSDDSPMLYISLFSSLITSTLFTLVSYKSILERRNGPNGILSVEFCYQLGNAIGLMVHLHPCMREKIIACIVTIYFSIFPFLLKILLRKNSTATTTPIETIEQ